ncbi:MAG: Holliday junction helicase RuvA [Bacteroidetes bacterium]|nr:Holliday junction helicase RuvA [Bacteroidota bacterium]
MIASLHGTLVRKSPTEIVIDVQGVGYGVSIPLSTFEVLGDLNTQVSLFTYLHVREDALQLFGFVSEEERNLFKLLISVTGIGPKMGQSILSGISGAELRNAIIQGNSAMLTSVPGVGRKLAERLVLELRDKIGKVSPGSSLLAASTEAQTQIRSEALLALTSLGYNRAAAERAIRLAIKDNSSVEASIELLIKAALRHAVK